MRASHHLADRLKSRRGENFRQFSYNDASRPVPNATIGYGHKLHSGPVTESDLENFQQGITPIQAERIFHEDKTEAEDIIQPQCSGSA